MLATTNSITIGIPYDWISVVREIQTQVTQSQPDDTFLATNSWYYQRGNALTIADTNKIHRIEALGWTPADALETYFRLRTFAEDWDAPGMEAYDDL